MTLGTANETNRVTMETFDGVYSHWLNSENSLKWDCLFVLPGWLKAWWSTFSDGSTPCLYTVKRGPELLGIAPLMVKGQEARFIGGPDVCDYQDFIVASDREQEFFVALIKHLRQQGITSLDLRPLRPDSSVLNEFVGVAASLKCAITCDQEDVSLELELPATWEEFLLRLTGKQRHEIRRKLRRLHEAGQVRYRAVEDIAEVRREMDTFLALFELNRPDKAAFMTNRMSSFFQSLAENMAEEKILRLFLLELDGTPAAAVMCFDYDSRIYLYNNGYDRRFNSLSVGLISKVLSIRDSIQRGKKSYDFLKGDEFYKRRLGGKPVSLYGCKVKLE